MEGTVTNEQFKKNLEQASDEKIKVTKLARTRWKTIKWALVIIGKALFTKDAGLCVTYTVLPKEDTTENTKEN